MRKRMTANEGAHDERSRILRVLLSPLSPRKEDSSHRTKGSSPRTKASRRDATVCAHVARGSSRLVSRCSRVRSVVRSVARVPPLASARLGSRSSRPASSSDSSSSDSSSSDSSSSDSPRLASDLVHRGRLLLRARRVPEGRALRPAAAVVLHGRGDRAELARVDGGLGHVRERERASERASGEANSRTREVGRDAPQQEEKRRERARERRPHCPLVRSSSHRRAAAQGGGLERRAGWAGRALSHAPSAGAGACSSRRRQRRTT